MLSFKCVIVLGLVTVAVNQGQGVYMEEPCSNQGGQCLPSSECAEDKRAALGLCPKQRSGGVECCFGASIKDLRCRAQGGDCTTGRCPENLIFRQATDCPAGQKCCIYV